MFCSYQLGSTQVSTGCGPPLSSENFLSGCHYDFGCLDMQIALCLEFGVGVHLALNLKFFVSVTYYDRGPREVPFAFYAFLFHYLSHLFFVSPKSLRGLRLCASDVPFPGQVTQAVYSLRLSFVMQTSPPNSRSAVAELLSLAAKTFAQLS